MGRFSGRLRDYLSTRGLYIGSRPIHQTPFAQRTRRRLNRLQGKTAALRVDLDRTQAIVSRLTTQVATMHRTQRALALFLTAQQAAGPSAEVLPDVTLERLGEAMSARPEVEGMVNVLLDLDYALVADDLCRAHGGPASLPRALQQRLAAELRARGYLARALVYTEAWAQSGSPGDRRVLELRRGEFEVMSGNFRPQASGENVDPVPGRVLHVVGFSLPMRQTGYTIRTHYTARAQLGAGLEPHVVTQSGKTPEGLATELTLDGVEYHHTGGQLGQGLGMDEWLQQNTDEVAAVVRRVRPAVLHAHSDFLNLLTAHAVGKATGLPVIYEARGFWEESWLSRTAVKFGWSDTEAIAEAFGPPDAYTWRKEREEEARALAQHVVTLSRGMVRRIAQAGVPPSRVTLAPNAVRATDFGWTPRDASLADSLAISADELVIGYISSLVEYEGIDTLIDAFRLVQAVTDRALRLLIVGDGDERSRLEAMAEQVEAGGVTFTGQVQHADVSRYYSLIDIFVVPRMPRTVCQLVTPLKPFEAFASGRTVVFSDVEALKEIAEDSGAAAIFEAGNARALADVLIELLGDPARCDQLARKGYEWVKSERTWEANAVAYLALYHALGVSLVDDGTSR